MPQAKLHWSHDLLAVALIGGVSSLVFWLVPPAEPPKATAAVDATPSTPSTSMDLLRSMFGVDNLFDKKYIGGLAYGAIYGAPRNLALSLEYKL